MIRQPANLDYSLGVSNFRLRNSVGLLGVLALCVSQAVAAPSISREGINFQVIGDAGNRAIQAGEADSFRVGRGSVGYEYGLSTTEVTVSQYFQFVDAYGKTTRYPEGSLLSKGIFLTTSTSSGYGMQPHLAQYAATLTWRNAARFCNWLHNGRINEAWAFERGAYDVSTFTTNPDGTFNDQATRSPGAKFWIPSLDEWIKGAYYDQDRYGASKAGYWQHPGGRNEYLVTGYPVQGGETDAGWNPDDGAVPLVPVGSFASVTGPWGLLDTSGGEREWSEELFDRTARVAMGSKRNDGLWFSSDDLSWPGTIVNPQIVNMGFRIATIPSPGAAAILCAAALLVSKRKR